MHTISMSVGSRYLVNRKKIRAVVEQVISKYRTQPCSVSISIVGERRMKELHIQYMNDPSVTDVLSFPQFDPTQPEKIFPVVRDFSESNESVTSEINLGDIVVCFPEAVRESKKLGKMVDDQINFLVEHGLMHLLGFHHD